MKKDNDLNSLIIEGKVHTEPEFRIVGTKKLPLTTIYIENIRWIRVGGELQPKVQIFPVEVWDKVPENIVKGAFVHILGRIVHDTWEANGNQRSRIKIVSENIYRKD